jgi:rod shape determining protein RodA
MFRQSTRLLLSYCLLILFAYIPPHRYQIWTPVVFTFSLGLLIAVLLVGKVGNGAQRWLDFGAFRFQPSEIMKIITPMMVAWYVSKKVLPINLKDASIASLIILFPALLIAKQPDLGTAIMVVASGATVLFFAGLSYRIILSLFGFLTITGPFLWHYLHDYQKQRVLTFLNPESDPLGSGYHIIQSKIAIGSGGLFGKGWLEGTQSHLHFLPEHTTDFIFAVLGEELGLIGCLLLILAFVMVVVRCLYIASVAPSTFTRLLTVSLTANFFLSAFVNMGMVTGILPVVGVPLPLVSYGGSSMVVFFAGFGIMMAIYSKRKILRHA